MLLTLSIGIWQQRKILNIFLQPEKITFQFYKKITAVVGWGLKSNTYLIRKLSEKKRIPFLHIEDGFIGYIGHPTCRGKRLSLIVDEYGVYYNAIQPSNLEHMLEDISWWDDAWKIRSKFALAKIIEYGITKYNHYQDLEIPLTLADKLNGLDSKILVIDQTFGDQSIKYGLATAESFKQMLSSARDENPTAQIIIRTHPDVVLGKKKGYLTALDLDSNMLISAEKCNPFSLLKLVDKVYTVTSQLGFEALLAGKEVVCFGVPFYAGWNLTDDRVSVPRRNKKRTLEQLFAASYLRYSNYADPITKQKCELEDLFDLIIAQRKYQAVPDAVIGYCFPFWKKLFIEIFALKIANKINFRKNMIEDKNISVLSWGNWQDDKLSKNINGTLWRIEDGFLRSVGLGADLKKPCSLTLDDSGMYYDPRQASRLENFLNTHEFTSSELDVGQKIINELKRNSLSKYNVGIQKSLNWRHLAKGRRIILIPGQVDDDASVLYGSPFVISNQELAIQVRKQEPESFIVFKYHPDVMAGHRVGGISVKTLENCVDYIETEANIIECFRCCDEVHTLTSLSGLEAMMHNKPVTVWGQPFYSSWGLTTDIYPLARRGRNLSLPAVVYASYAWYPVYFDWKVGIYSTVMHTIYRINQDRINYKPESKIKIISWVLRRIRRVVFLCEVIWLRFFIVK